MGSVEQKAEVIAWDYQFAPNAQKARNLLNVAGIPFRICEQPFLQPRPILQNIGITYRRVPVNSIGKDVYIDNRAFIDAVEEIFPEKALPTTKHDHAYEAFGYRNFWIILASLPLVFLTPELIEERHDLFPVFGKKNYKQLRPSTLTELKSFLNMIENDFLADATDAEPWINGAKPGLADIHASWVPKFALETLKYSTDEPGFSEADYPKVHRWLAGIPAHVPESEPEKLSAEIATQQILSSQYAAKEIGVDESDLMGLKKGQKVYVQTSDDNAPENAQQHGTLIGLGPRQIVIELENGLRLHFPRVGYAVLSAH
ncbi:hypothetical protein H2198_007862 [Neophaeococcomyces mojaviensis]|uniref:Uncharacterized protein n=1 Tax=Neophaeococcomyces mojaviensis TaxID=3383035 RepID=A0ACC2ZYX8_9EURO|nr:hypothetical protein H2198_007862 [Knufia sp. JES_112]